MRREMRNLRRFVEVLVLFLVGCSPSKPSATPAQRLGVVKNAAQCQAEGSIAIFEAKTCADAKARLDDLIRTSPECMEIFTGNRGWSLDCSKQPLHSSRRHTAECS